MLMFLKQPLILPSLAEARRRSLSPVREKILTHRPVASTFTEYKPSNIYRGKESSVKLPKINQQALEAISNNSLMNSPVKDNKNNDLKHYYKLSKIQRENNALRDFIHNIQIKQPAVEIPKADNSEIQSRGIAGNVQKYFNQLEEYIRNL